MLQSRESQIVGHDSATEKQQMDCEDLFVALSSFEMALNSGVK